MRRTVPMVALLIAVASLWSCSKSLAPADPGARSRPAAVAELRGKGSRPIRLRLRFHGTVVSIDASGQPVPDPNHDFFVTVPLSGPSRLDTIPAYAMLQQVSWLKGDDDLEVAGRFSAEAVQDSVRPPGTDSLLAMPPGPHHLTFAVPARLGGGSVTAHFFVGFTPVSWWAGPDTRAWPLASDGHGRAVDVTDWSRFTTVPAWPADGRPFFGPDSFRFRPSMRRRLGDGSGRRTFYEIYGNRIYARSDGDTLHLNSVVVLCSGGFDRDSRYVPLVDARDPGLPPGFAGSPDLYALLVRAGVIGSPTGFRMQPFIRLPNGDVLRGSQTTEYPNFLVTSVFFDPQVMGYWPVHTAGKHYLVISAEDRDGLVETPVADPVGVADRVDAGAGSVADREMRRRIVTFHVPQPPDGVAERTR